MNITIHLEDKINYSATMVKFISKDICI